MTNYKLEPLPRDSDGNVLVDKYREILWFSAQRTEQDVCKINDTVKKHSEAIEGVKKDVFRIKAIGSAIVVVFAGFNTIKRFLIGG